MKKIYSRVILAAFALVMIGVVVFFLPAVMESSAEKGSDPIVTLWEAPITTSQPAPITTNSYYELIPCSSEELSVPMAPVESTEPKPGPEWGPHENDSYSYFVKTKGEISDGVYALFNIGTYRGRLGYKNGALRMVDYEASPAATLNADGLFTITRVPDTERYIIRHLVHDTLTIGFFDGEFAFKTIPEKDADVKIEDTFTINCYEHGFVITPYGAAASICCDLENNLVWGTHENCGYYARWYFERFMGEIPEELMP